MIGDREGKDTPGSLAMYDLEAIVGIDWLVKQNAVMDCSGRVIQFSPAGHPRSEFVGSRGRASFP